MREPISVASVEGGSRFEAVWRLQDGSNISRSSSDQLAQWTDGGGNPVVGGAQKPASILYCAHPRHVQMLARRAVIPIPSIIRKVDEQLGPVPRETADLVGKDGLVADE